MPALRIDADLLIPGIGEPIADGSVVLDGDRITYAGPAAGAPPGPRPEDGGDPAFRVPALLPGLWDSHAHFMGLTKPDLATFATTNQIEVAARSTQDLRAVLDAGFTSVREVGGFGLRIAPAIDDGTLLGPTVYGAGAILSTTGGHGDIHALPLDWIGDPRFAGTEGLQLCDGVPECLRAVRLQLRKGAQVIKICASGGVMSEIDHPVHQQFSEGELTAIVEEAARADRVVAAHCHGKPGIMAALRAGARTIEHGSYLDAEAIELMLQTGAMLVPTRFVVEELLKMKESLPAYAYDKAVRIADRHAEATRMAIEAGVAIAAGMDWFVSGSSRYGELSREVRYLVGLGMTPLQAVEAMTANGPLTLGPQAPHSGRLEPGYDADVIAVDADPLTDIAVWGDPKRVTHVWKRGSLVKTPAAPSIH